MADKPESRAESGQPLKKQVERDKEDARKWSGSKPDRGADQNRVKPSD